MCWATSGQSTIIHQRVYSKLSELTAEALIDDIRMDIKIASESLKRLDYSAYRTVDFWNV